MVLSSLVETCYIRWSPISPSSKSSSPSLLAPSEPVRCPPRTPPLWQSRQPLALPRTGESLRLLPERPFHPLHRRWDYLTNTCPRPQRHCLIVGRLALFSQDHPDPKSKRQTYQRSRRLHHERGTKTSMTSQWQACGSAYLQPVSHRPQGGYGPVPRAREGLRPHL